MENPRRNHYLRPLLAAPLAALLLAAGPTDRAGRVQQVRRAVEVLVQSYLIVPQSPDEQKVAATLRSRAIDAIAAGGMLGREPLREALQRKGLPTDLLYTLATLLVLGEGRTAAPFVLDVTEPADPSRSPGEAFYLAHTLMTRSQAEGSRLALRLAALPPSTRFPVPAEGIAFPHVAAVAFLYAAGESQGLNELAGLLERIEELPQRQAETLLRAAGMLVLVRLVPLLLEKSEKLPPGSPLLRPLIYALGQIDDPRAAERLSHFARKAKDRALREEAVFALGELASPVCEKPLLAALADDSAGVRSYAAGALTALGTPPARKALRRALGGGESDPKVRADLIRAAQVAGDRSWGEALEKAEKSWPALATKAREAFLAVQRTDPYEEARPATYWAELPMNRVGTGQLTADLWDIIEAGGAGFSAIKKTVLYSGTASHLPHLETLRMVAARNLTRQGLGAWLDVLDTLKLLRRRLREDPRPSFSRPDPAGVGRP